MHEMQAKSRRFRKDAEYYEAHQAELLQQYPDSWVAILDQQVVGAGSDARELLSDLSRRDIPIERALVEFVTAKDDLLILPG